MKLILSHVMSIELIRIIATQVNYYQYLPLHRYHNYTDNNEIYLFWVLSGRIKSFAKMCRRKKDYQKFLSHDFQLSVRLTRRGFVCIKNALNFLENLFMHFVQQCFRTRCTIVLVWPFGGWENRFSDCDRQSWHKRNL